MPLSVFERVETLLKESRHRFQRAPARAGVHERRGGPDPRHAAGQRRQVSVFKGDDRFVMFVVPADRKLDSRAVRRDKGWRKLRFASREEVAELTGLAPGSIPPFGTLFNLPTLCDQRLGENESINFNAGDHSISVSMRDEDYLIVERPEMGMFAE